MKDKIKRFYLILYLSGCTQQLHLVFYTIRVFFIAYFILYDKKNEIGNCTCDGNSDMYKQINTIVRR